MSLFVEMFVFLKVLNQPIIKLSADFLCLGGHPFSVLHLVTVSCRYNFMYVQNLDGDSLS